ncbi:MAG: hypothetical protein IJU01_04575 [Lachnospiraceae bacterium]|nr:hypothetical protein [Lachnospiraceae bacterium]
MTTPITSPEGTPVFVSVAEACRITGIAKYAIRKGCNAGTVPYIDIGNKFMINLPMYLDQLNAQTIGREG